VVSVWGRDKSPQRAVERENQGFSLYSGSQLRSDGGMVCPKRSKGLAHKRKAETVSFGLSPIVSVGDEKGQKRKAQSSIRRHTR